ncbi:MAG: nitroreductase family protein [Candidatus Berkelbacteria bacterium]|nr:nitroreductase family protein [Candidatus Berkelbacteria bacterium]
MDFLELVKKRRSVRAYQNKSIPDRELSKILEAARLAPSGFNAQAYKIIVIKDEKSREKLGELAKQPYISKAPIILAAVNTKLDDKYSPLDIAIALDHIMLAAAELGIGTVFVGAYHNEEIRDFVGAPNTAEMVALMPLGYPADKEIAKKRKEISELISQEKF